MADNTSRYSTIYLLDGTARYFVLPNIQSLSVPDSSSIPSRPTVTGEYRNQYVNQSVRKVTIVAWLEDGLFGGVFYDAATTIASIQNLKGQRIRFNMTTTHAQEDSQFLTNLVIENASYQRDAANRNRIVATINAVQVRLVDLSWVQDTSSNVFGQDVFSNGDVETQRNDSSVEEAAEHFGENSEWWQKYKDFILDGAYLQPETNPNAQPYTMLRALNTPSLLYAKGKTNTGGADLSAFPIAAQIYDQIKNDVPLKDSTFFYKLGAPIDMSTGSGVYNSSSSFETEFGTNGIEKYKVNVADLNINVTKKESNLVEGFPLGYYLTEDIVDNAIVADKIDVPTSFINALDLRSKYNTQRFVYDFGDTYPQFGVNKSFSNLETADKLSSYLSDQIDNNRITIDPDATPGLIMIQNGMVWTRPIKSRYSFEIKLNNGIFSKKYIPSGGLDVVIDKVTTKGNHYVPKILNSRYQDKFSRNFQDAFGNPDYKLYIVAITLGTMLDVYLFSDMFTNDIILKN
jgi:hypothetical protein